MNKEKAKQTLELMLMSDAHMQALGQTCLRLLQKGIDDKDREYWEEDTDWNKFRQEQIALRDTYAKIDVSRLSEETGKSIVEKCQPLVAEFYQTYIPLFDAFISSGFKPQEVPKRLYEIVNIVMDETQKHLQLKARGLYFKARNIGYFECQFPEGVSHTVDEWHIAGKPVQVHPEKLAELLK